MEPLLLVLVGKTWRGNRISGFRIDPVRRNERFGLVAGTNVEGAKGSNESVEMALRKCLPAIGIETGQIVKPGVVVAMPQVDRESHEDRCCCWFSFKYASAKTVGWSNK